jgi:Uma2 family endonuclease
VGTPVVGEFDPLREFAGMWDVRLAERYLPVPGLPRYKYECVDGRLFLGPRGDVGTSYGKVELASWMREAAHAAGQLAVAEVNLVINPQRWIEPDVTVLYRVPPAGEDLWVPVDCCAMPVEFVSPSSRHRDRIDKPAVCAAAGVPYFMRVEIERRLRHVDVTLWRLEDGAYELAAHAIAGQEFAMVEPFPLSFDPVVLLVP